MSILKEAGRNKWLCSIALCLATALACGNIQAQDTSTTTRIPGQPTVQTEVRRGRVVYVSGNDVVVKTEDGQVKDFDVPERTRFTVDGKDLSVHQLTPGMMLTQTITTVTTPYTVKTVRTINGKVWHVSAPKKVILSFPDGPNKEYTVPEGTMFQVDGKQKSIFELRKGVNISATVITESPEDVMTTEHRVTGRTPTPPTVAVTPPPDTPTVVGVLLIERPATVSTARPLEPPPQEATNRLPKTASSVPLMALLGMMFIGTSFGIGVLRRR